MDQSYITGCTDTPVNNTNEDLFNVSTYVNGLCSFIGTCDTPMTISIQGDWGSGKTSMMNMIRSKMEDTVIPIWFNTWQFSQFDMGNTLAFSMMDVLLKGLDCDKDVRKKIISGLAGFGRKALKIATDHAIGGEAAEAVGEFISGSDEEDYASEIVALKDKFQDAVNRTIANNPGKNRVVIFVDDLDRLQPSRAVELLEVLKLFLDCRNCVFILAVDYEVVTLGIRQKYGTDVDAEKGRSFFDKIIQLPFKMPVAQYDIRNYVDQMLKRQGIDVDRKEGDLFSNLIRTSIGFNPRSMKRLFNTYQLLNIITGTAVYDVDKKVRERVLFAIICAQMSYDRFYQYLASAKSIDPDLLQSLNNPETSEETVRDLFQDDDDDASEVRKKYRRLAKFIPYFIQALQIDDDMNLSKEEMDNMSSILKCSLVTSVGGQTEDVNGDLEYEYRYANREYVKKIQSFLEDLPENEKSHKRTWLPRKAHEDEGIKFSDASFYYSWEEEGLGCWVNLECYFSRVTDQLIDVRFYLTCEDKHFAKQFHDRLGENPLGLSERPEWLEWGRYRYMHAHQISDNDEGTLKQIADQMRMLVKIVQTKLRA